MMKNCQIDLETMSTQPNAAIIGIGAVFFDHFTGEMGEPFYRAVHLASAAKWGGHIEPSTVIWWLSQSQEARDAVRFSTYPIEVALQDLRDWMIGHAPEADIKPWGNAASFDLTVLGTAFDRCKIARPWRYYNEMCYRTLKNLYPSIPGDDRSGGTHHKADDDAVWQARHMIKIVKTLKEANARPETTEEKTRTAD